MKYVILTTYTIICLIMTQTNVFAKDVSNQMTGYNSGIVLSCTTRMGLYAGNSKNVFEMPDPNFTKTMVENTIKISIPYYDNVRNAAWKVYPLNQDWDKFYQTQIDLVNKNYNTNNVFFDTMGCVQDLMRLGVMYPKPSDPSKMPPEQMSILKKLMQKK